jgi:hypothetical protein
VLKKMKKTKKWFLPVQRRWPKNSKPDLDSTLSVLDHTRTFISYAGWDCYILVDRCRTAESGERTGERATPDTLQFDLRGLEGSYCAVIVR